MRGMFQVWCENCGAESREDADLSTDEIIQKWNARPIEDALKSAFRWIPVSEKLPEPGRPVLVLDATVTPPQFAMAEHGDWPLLTTDTFGMTITHWAAMPPLPEKDG